MIRIVLILIILAAAFYLISRISNAKTNFGPHWKRNLLLTGGGILLIILLLTGKLNWLFALIGLLIAGMSRYLPVLLRYAPVLQRLWFEYLAKRQHGSSQQQNRNSGNGMSIEEARQILGVPSGATKEEIIAAHKRLMQKVHPDRGGSDYLASRINLAKKTLLG